MAITAAEIYGPSSTPVPSPDSAAFDLTKALDGDVALVLAHGFTNGIPQGAIIQVFGPNADEGILSLWRVVSIDAVNITLRTSAAVGSGAAGVQARLYMARPHSLLAA